MHGEQAGDFFHRHAPVRIRLNPKTHCACGTLTQYKTL
jgi:hypothetical protein